MLLFDPECLAMVFSHSEKNGLWLLRSLYLLSFDIISESLLNLSKKLLHCYNDVIAIDWICITVGVVKFVNPLMPGCNKKVAHT